MTIFDKLEKYFKETSKEDVQKEIRRDIKTLLRKIKFPPNKLEVFTREILDLARTRFKDYNGIH